MEIHQVRRSVQEYIKHDRTYIEKLHEFINSPKNKKSKYHYSETFHPIINISTVDYYTLKDCEVSISDKPTYSKYLSSFTPVK
jgi:hypothetical protein